MYRGKKIVLTAMTLNEERLIGPTLESVPDLIDHVYIVDDGSTDKTCEIVRQYAQNDPRIELIVHERNMGVGQTIITGYSRSSADGYDITES